MSSKAMADAAIEICDVFHKHNLKYGECIHVMAAVSKLVALKAGDVSAGLNMLRRDLAKMEAAAMERESE